MRRITGKGKKIMAVLTAAGMLAGSVCPTYATVVGNMAGEQDTVAQPTTGEMQQGDIIALDDIGISIKVSGYTSIRESDGFIFTQWQMTPFLMSLLENMMRHLLIL